MRMLKVSTPSTSQKLSLSFIFSKKLYRTCPAVACFKGRGPLSIGHADHEHYIYFVKVEKTKIEGNNKSSSGDWYFR